MDYNEIKQLIDDNIKPNTNQDITAIVANLVMTGMIDYTRDSIINVVNQGFGAGAFTWLDVEHGAVIPYPQMSAGRARVVRIFKDGVPYVDGEATIGGVNGVTIKRHALVICLEATNESANDGMQETVGDRFAVINVDGSGSVPSLTLEQARQNGNVLEGDVEMLPNTSLFVGEDSISAKSFLKFNQALSRKSTQLGGESDVSIISKSILLVSDDIDPNYPERSIRFQLISGDDDFSPLAQALLEMDASTKGLVGNNEFDKQGDRKAFAQIADVEDAINGGGVFRGKGFIGRSVTANVSGSYTVDFNDMAEHYILTMQDNTSIVFDNMISDEETVVITLTVQGNYSLLLPSFLVASPDNDDYDGNLNNEIVINIKRGGANPLGYYTLKSYEI